MGGNERERGVGGGEKRKKGVRKEVEGGGGKG